MSELGPSGLGDDREFGLATPGIASFHRALQAALHSRVALDLGRVTPAPDRGPRGPAKSSGSRGKMPSGRLTRRKLRDLEALTQASPFDGPGRPADPREVLAAAYGEVAGELPEKYVNGFSVYLVTGRTDLVLDAMSVNSRAQRELARVARPSLAYLAIMVVVGVLGSGVLMLVLMGVDDLRADLLLVPQPVSASPAVTRRITDARLFLSVGIAVPILLIAAASLLRPVSAGIAKCLGGFGYLVSQRRATAARVEHALLQSGVEGAAAKQTSTGLVGYQPRRKRTYRTVSRGDQSPSDVQHSKLEAKHCLAWSDTRLRQLRFGLPLLLVLTLGSAGVLLYSLALFVPLTNLLHEMAAPLVDPATQGGRR